MPRLIVMKIGGSLCGLPDFGARLRWLIETSGEARHLLIVGGGPAADLVRTWDDRHELGEEASHWLALQSLQLTAGLAKTVLLPAEQLCQTTQAVDAVRGHPGVSILDMHDIFQDVERRGESSVPHLWEVTSDSIAAWVCKRWDADELLLAKSVQQPQLSLEAAAETGLVDAYFPRLARTLLQVSWCNLRHESPVIRPWLRGGREHFDADGP